LIIKLNLSLRPLSKASHERSFREKSLQKDSRRFVALTSPAPLLHELSVG